MSYIEREVAQGLLQKRSEELLQAGEPTLGGAVSGANRLLSLISAADVAPVVHGEWIEAKLNGMSLYPVGQKMCSICGQIMPSRWKTMPPFCYGCGALMDDDRIV